MNKMTFVYDEAVFLTQVTVSFSIIGFCMCQIIRNQQTEVFIPLLTATAGYWFPSPKLSGKSSTTNDIPNDIENPTMRTP